MPPSDLVQEFKVQTATFDAQFGNTEGGVTSISIKSGTNRFRGSAYYFAEPYKLGANDFFGKARGQAIIESSSDRPGFTIGGPLGIPKLYDGKDKTFFMFGFEHIKDVRPRFDAGGQRLGPDRGAAQRRLLGLLVEHHDLRSADPPGHHDLHRAAVPRQHHPGEPDQPDRRRRSWSTTPCRRTRAWPATSSTRRCPRRPTTTASRAAIDQKISNNNRMFARYSWYFRDSIYNDYLNSLATHTMFQFESYQVVVDDVHVFNPTTVLNVRYGYNRFDRISGFRDEVYGFDQTQLGFPAAYNALVPEANRLFPRLDVDGDMIDIAVGGDRRPVTSHTVVATLNKSLGAHSVKSGAEMRIYGERNNPPGNDQSGRYQFTNAYTRQSSASGTDYQGLQTYAAFLLGMPSTTSITRPAAYDEYSTTWGFFVQDDWRVSDKLTLNLGLRYEVESPMVERQDQSVSNFDYDYVQPIQGAAQANYAALNDPALKALVPQLYVEGRAAVRGRGHRDAVHARRRTRSCRGSGWPTS